MISIGNFAHLCLNWSVSIKNLFLFSRDIWSVKFQWNSKIKHAHLFYLPWFDDFVNLSKLINWFDSLEDTAKISHLSVGLQWLVNKAFLSWSRYLYWRLPQRPFHSSRKRNMPLVQLFSRRKRRLVLDRVVSCFNNEIP